MNGYLAFILPVGGGGGGQIDNSLPGMGGPVDPGYGRPIFHPGHPDNGLPSQPVDPGWGGGWGGGGRPDNSLPGSGGRPDNSLPGLGGRPDNSLPGSGARPDQGLPGYPQPKPAATQQQVGEPPAAVDPTNGSWVLVALGNNKLGWAWLPKSSHGGGGQVDNSLPDTPQPKK